MIVKYLDLNRMSIPHAVLELENRFCGEEGEPTLAAAFDILYDHWQAGERNRELGLHLMFISWYGIIEPEHITGFSNDVAKQKQLQQVFAETHRYFEPQIVDDAELLFAFGLAVQMFWFMFDDAAIWEQRAKQYRLRYRELAPAGIRPEVFHNRGAYGAYYAKQSDVIGGF